MALKKSQLYSSLWKSCDELRGGMDASQYKDYVLTLLFMKYVSDRHAGRPDAVIEVPAGGGFADIAALKGRKDIGEQINTIIAAFAEANDLQGVIDQADFDDDSKLGSGAEKRDRLSKLVAIFEGLDFRANRAGGDDLLGDAYEYLMLHFATESGKSKGQFYTPAEVSRVIAQVVGIGPDTRQDQTIYDPTCGSGSLLLKAADQAPGGITVYGQEMDNATWALARMNMILHGHATAELHRGNTLAAPHFKNGIFMFDASRGFRKDGNKNRLRAQDIHRIVDVFNRQTEAPRYSRMVPVSEIADPANDYNLNIPRYVDATEPEDLHDLDAHLNGGIPDRDLDVLGHWWEVFPSLRATLFENAGRPGCSRLRVDQPDKPAIHAAIRDHPEVADFRQQVADVFDIWRNVHRPILQGLVTDNVPADVIDTLSENLLACFSDLPLISSYDVYQRLMDYWDEVMQDDVHLVVSDGWVDAAKPRATIEDEHRQIKEVPDFTVQRRRYKMGLVPPPLIVARWFAEKQAEVDKLQATHDEVARALQALIEDHSSTADGDDGPLATVVNEKGKVTKVAVMARIREVEADLESHYEMEHLLRCLAQMDAKAATNRAVKASQAVLDAQALARYDTLTAAEIKTLVVDDKWLAVVRSAIDHETQQAMSRFTARVLQLERRYAEPLPRFKRQMATLAAKTQLQIDETAAQQLLVGESRLPGFGDTWQRKRIGDLLTYERPDRYVVHSTDYTEHGNVPVLTGNKSFILGYTDEAFGVCRDIPAIVFDDFTTNCKYTDIPFKVKSSAIKLLRAKHDRVNLRYIFERMRLVRFTVGDHKRYYISEYQNIELCIPDYDEQTAIVSVLSDVDAEIGTLKRHIDKIVAIRQGMAQQLLAGRVRLRESGRATP